MVGALPRDVFEPPRFQLCGRSYFFRGATLAMRMIDAPLPPGSFLPND